MTDISFVTDRIRYIEKNNIKTPIRYDTEGRTFAPWIFLYTKIHIIIAVK